MLESIINHLTLFDAVAFMVIGYTAYHYGEHNGIKEYPVPKYKPGDSVVFRTGDRNSSKETGVIVESQVRKCALVRDGYFSKPIDDIYSFFRVVYRIDTLHIVYDREIHRAGRTVTTPDGKVVTVGSGGPTNYIWVKEEDIGVKVEGDDIDD